MVKNLADLEINKNLVTFDSNLIDQNFPKPEYREGQRKAIEFAVNAFNKGIKIVIIEGPTGSGKSSIGITLANMVNSSYYLTATKILQDQLVNDFEDIVELKGRNSYPCTYWDRYKETIIKRKLMSAKIVDELSQKHADCANGFCKTKHNKGEKSTNNRCPKCFPINGPMGDGNCSGDLHKLSSGIYSNCPYYEQVFHAINSPKVTMNYSSFLFQTRMTKRFDNRRDLIIIDEAHNIEKQLMNFVELNLSDKHLRQYGVFLPDFESAEEYYGWFNHMQIHKKIMQLIANARKNDETSLVDYFTRFLDKYNLFKKSIEEDVKWVCDFEQYGQTKEQSHNMVKMKPIFIKTFTKPLLLNKAHYALLMSATILDVNVLCDSLGLKKEEIAAYRMKNSFPKENRPIYIETVAKMTGGRGRMAEWAPKLSTKVNEICNKYENKKGIIHTHNFAIMDWLLRHCSKDVKSRFLNQKNYNHKGELLEAHAKSVNGIIIAPAMHEGIDLADDLSRFQIICKVPYANFYEDQQLSRRMELDRRYYTWITALKLVQAYGRSIRSKTDYADTYILDESIFKFLKNAGKMIPNWFQEAIVDSATT
jgi:Rad3-related DNA helicase